MKYLKIFEGNGGGVLENINMLSNKLYLLYDEGLIDGDCNLKKNHEKTLEELNGALEKDQYPKYKSIEAFGKDVAALKLACKIFADK